MATIRQLPRNDVLSYQLILLLSLLVSVAIAGISFVTLMTLGNRIDLLEAKVDALSENQQVNQAETEAQVKQLMLGN
jgi:hypothetical protein